MEIIHKARLPHGMASIFMEWVFLCSFFILLSLLIAHNHVVSMMANTSPLLSALDLEQIRFTNIFCKSINIWGLGFTTLTHLRSRKQFIQTVSVLALSLNFRIKTFRCRDMQKRSTCMYIFLELSSNIQLLTLGIDVPRCNDGNPKSPCSKNQNRRIYLHI